MTGYERDLYMLAFDHRGSFQKQLLDIAETPTPAQAERIADIKAVIFEGFLEAHATGRLGDGAGILVDEQFGATVARRAKQTGVVLAMPAEASGRDEFDFEYGSDFAAHIEAFDPAFTKVLVRHNPEGDQALNERQTARLRRLADWLHAHGRKLLFELLVPATAEQLDAVDEDRERYDREVRPGLVVRSIAALQAAGVEADVWKIEGLDERADCRRVAEQARHGGRDGVACIVLGRGASAARVEQWLRAGAGVPGYRGFAIGRTIWWDALVGFRDARLSRAEAASRIAANYLQATDAYRASALAAPPVLAERHPARGEAR
jgi:myo-inositol catabolism protein IolC